MLGPNTGTNSAATENLWFSKTKLCLSRPLPFPKAAKKFKNKYFICIFKAFAGSRLIF